MKIAAIAAYACVTVGCFATYWPLGLIVPGLLVLIDLRGGIGGDQKE